MSDSSTLTLDQSDLQSLPLSAISHSDDRPLRNLAMGMHTASSFKGGQCQYHGFYSLVEAYTSGQMTTLVSMGDFSRSTQFPQVPLQRERARQLIDRRRSIPRLSGLRGKILV